MNIPGKDCLESIPAKLGTIIRSEIQHVVPGQYFLAHRYLMYCIVDMIQGSTPAGSTMSLNRQAHSSPAHSSTVSLNLNYDWLKALGAKVYYHVHKLPYQSSKLD